MKQVHIGDTFTWDERTILRLPDGPCTNCQYSDHPHSVPYIRTLANPMVVNFQPRDYEVEDEWFRQRGFEASSQQPLQAS